MRVYRSCLKAREFFGEREEKVMIYYIAALIPALELDPWTQVKVWSFFDTRRENRRGSNWFGCQNSTKTSTCAALAIAFGVLHPEATNQKVAEPFKVSGEKKIWFMVQKFAESAKEAHRAELQRMRCSIKNATTMDYVRFGMYPGSGFLDLIAADEPGKLQGAKSSDRDQSTGWLIAYLDEIALHPTQAFLEVLPNLTSNYNFHFFTDCNPELVPGQLDTELGKPKGGYRKLDLDSDFRWLSAYGTVTYRFDGLKSPNMEFSKDRYPYIFGRKRLHYFEDAYGKGNPKYNAQVRGLSPAGMDGFFVTSLEKLEAGKVFKQFQWLEKTPHEVGFLDPGFGGDPAIFTHLSVGLIRDLSTPEGFEAIVCREQFEIPVRPSAEIDEEWLPKIFRARGNLGEMKMGDKLDPGKQLAIEAAIACIDRGIPYFNFGYDDSMRGWVVTAIIWAMGTGVLTVSYEGKPQNRKIWPKKFTEVAGGGGKQRPKLWSDECSKFVSQVWFQGAEILHAGQLFRGGDLCQRGLDQMENRRWKQSGYKKDIESKDDYKTKFKESPDHADSLLGALHVVVERNLIALTFDKAVENERSSGKVSLNSWKIQNRQTHGLRLTGSKS